jgi:hypothetical protein
MDSRTLDDIACLYGTDKASTGHNYAHTYESLFWQRRDDQITLLEIGVWEGASLAMWRAYFPHALIVGLDVDTSRARSDYIDGSHIHQGDASKEEFIAEIIGEYGVFDIVIDDGSHMSRLAQSSFRLLWPHVASRGWYVIEDLHTYWWTRANPPGSEEWLLDMACDAMGHGDSRQDGMSHNTAIDTVIFRLGMAAIQRKA